MSATLACLAPAPAPSDATPAATPRWAIADGLKPLLAASGMRPLQLAGSWLLPIVQGGMWACRRTSWPVR